MTEPCAEQKKFHIILFYRYVRLAQLEDVARLLQAAMDRAASLSGRILLADEGVNGNLAAPEASMLQFVSELLDIQPLGLRHEDIKSSKTMSTVDPFPDLRLRRVKHLIAGGEALDSIPIEETARGYLSPAEWMQAAGEDDSVLIDVRNVRETAIGHFDGALDPKTKHFSEFSRWLDNQETQQKLRGKRVLMYCTGGVRCEKASALLRRKQVAKSVEHLHGGIHRFQEDLGDADGFWKGKMFVFDRRGAMSSNEFAVSGQENESQKKESPRENGSAEKAEQETIVGRCRRCSKPFDVFHPDAVCVVCREPCLVCDGCRDTLNGEYHCEDHDYLKEMYFSNLDRFSDDALRHQRKQLREELEKIQKGKEHRNKRRTLSRQVARVSDALRSRLGEEMEGRIDEKGKGPLDEEVEDRMEKPRELQDREEPGRKRAKISADCGRKCRSCGDRGCSGDCWGFWGVKRAEKQVERAES